SVGQFLQVGGQLLDLLTREFPLDLLLSTRKIFCELLEVVERLVLRGGGRLGLLLLKRLLSLAHPAGRTGGRAGALLQLLPSQLAGQFIGLIGQFLLTFAELFELLLPLGIRGRAERLTGLLQQIRLLL